MARTEKRGDRQQRSTAGTDAPPAGPPADAEEYRPSPAELAKHRPSDQQVRELADRD